MDPFSKNSKAEVLDWRKKMKKLTPKKDRGQNPLVKTLLKMKNENNYWTKPSLESLKSEGLEWDVNMDTPQESVPYLEYFFMCADSSRCFLCERALRTSSMYENHPCGCTLWCLHCKEWVQTTQPSPYLCVICRAQVKSWRNCSENRGEETFISSFLQAFKESRKLSPGLNFTQDYELCKKENLCFLCRKKEMLYYNSSCGCTLFCLQCAVRVLKMTVEIEGNDKACCIVCDKEPGTIERLPVPGGLAAIEEPKFIFQSLSDSWKKYRDGEFFKYTTMCLKNKNCFGCLKGKLEWKNQPCGCPIWCSKCKEHLVYLDDFSNLRSESKEVVQTHICRICTCPVKYFQAVNGDKCQDLSGGFPPLG